MPKRGDYLIGSFSFLFAILLEIHEGFKQGLVKNQFLFDCADFRR